MSEPENASVSQPPLTTFSPFIGREYELAVLEAGLEAALAGHGQVIVLAGEPGVGKTRLIGEFVANGSARHIQAHWGRCDPWDAVSAYWPWIQVLRSCLTTSFGESLRAGGEAVLAEMTRALPDTDGAPAVNGLTVDLGQKRARFRLFEDIATLIAEAASERPLIVVLDDLHWGDGPSLALLRFLGRSIRDTRVLILTTYRTGAGGNEHLMDALSVLAGEPNYRRMALRGFTRAETASFVENAIGYSPVDRLVDVVFQQTDGNPFFVTEVVRLATEMQFIHDDVAPGRLPRIPESVRDVIGERLRRLPEDCRTALDAAAVIGREFQIVLLARITGQSVQRLLAMIEAAADALIVEEADGIGEYRFTHALIQEALYTTLGAADRAQLHRHVGESLEQHYGDERAEHAIELMRHFRLAAPLGCADKAIGYGKQAAETAFGQHGWELAADLYQQTLQLFDLLDESWPAERCEVLLALGDAQNWAGEGRDRATLAGVAPDAVETFWQAARLARSIGSAQQLARAALGLAGPNLGTPHARSAGISLFEEALAGLPEDASALRSRLLARISVDRARLWAIGEAQPRAVDWRQQSDEAVVIARKSGDARAIGFALAAGSIACEGPALSTALLHDADEILRLAEMTADVQMASYGLLRRHLLLLRTGRIAEADDALRALGALAVESMTPMIQWQVAAYSAGDALRRGAFDEADRQIAVAQLLWPHAAVPMYQLTTLRREQGRMFDVADVIDTRLAAWPRAPIWRAIRLVLQLETDQADAASDGLAAMASQQFSDLPRGSLWLRTMAWLAEVAAELGDREHARQIYDLLIPYREQNLFTGTSDQTGGSLSYYLGLLATAMGWLEVAEQHYSVALADNERWGIRPYLAQTLFAMGVTLQDRDGPGARKAALAYLNRARLLADDMGMSRLRQRIDALPNVPVGGSDSGTVNRYGLSAREREVLRLVVDGQADRDIASTLSISRRTVGSHVSSILSKLDVSTRTQATAMAIREELV